MKILHTSDWHIGQKFMEDENENELIPINKEDKLQGVLCAVPFLRDSIVRNDMDIQNGTTSKK